MKFMKQVFAQSLLRLLTRKNRVSQLEVIDLAEKQCIGYMITTSFEGNQKKKDIPPFYHDIYDNDKLHPLQKNCDKNMYCIFDLHENGKDFDYHVAVEKQAGVGGKNYSEITLPRGRYVQVEFMKRNHSAAGQIVGYTKMWIESNGYKERNSPPFILYGERFHSNYRKFGCKDGNYLGDPVAALYIPLV